MTALLDQGAGCFYRLFYYAIHGDSIKPELNSTGGYARYFHQVIDQMGQLAQLTLNYYSGLLL